MEKINKAFLDLGLQKEDKVLIAYSGGPDSTFLLYNALSYFKTIEIAYVNYHDSEFTEKETKIIDEFCKNHHLNINVLNVNLHYTSIDFENKARKIRYNYFKKIILNKNLKGVLVAHHKNDDAETYLMQVQRNSIVNTYGLSKINKIHNILVYRPLLNCTKEEIIEYLNKKNIEFFDDPTNYNIERKRDNIRLNTITSKEKLEEIIKEKNEKQKENEKVKKEAINYLKQKKFEFITYRQLSKNTQLRICYMLSQKILKSTKEDRIVSLTHEIFEFLKSNNSNSLLMKNNLYLYKSKFYFFFSNQTFNNEYSYTIKEKGKYNFDSLKINLTNPNKIHINKFPLYIKPVTSNSQIGTNFPQKNPIEIIKKHNVPSFLRNNYPAIFNNENKIVYLPLSWENDNIINIKIKKKKFKF